MAGPATAGDLRGADVADARFVGSDRARRGSRAGGECRDGHGNSPRCVFDAIIRDSGDRSRGTLGSMARDQPDRPVHPAQRHRLRGVPGDGRLVVSPPSVRALRPHRLLRHVAVAARSPACRRRAAPDRSELRAGRGLVLRLRVRPDARRGRSSPRRTSIRSISRFPVPPAGFRRTGRATSTEARPQIRFRQIPTGSNCIGTSTRMSSDVCDARMRSSSASVTSAASPVESSSPSNEAAPSIR